MNAEVTGEQNFDESAPAEQAVRDTDEEVSLKMEIERKWKISIENLPDAAALGTGVDIWQGYLAIAEDGTEVRLRQAGETFYQTVKSGGDLARDEFETEIPQEVFDALWPATERARVEKVRYAIAYAEGVTIEVDVYKGALKGLIVAEVEFSDIRASEQFVAPAWFGEEVTANKAYKNKNLATRGLPA